MSRSEQAGRPGEGPVPAFLERLAQHLSVEAIDEVWVFPTRRIGSSDSTVLVASAFTGEDDRRRVVTAHFTHRRDPRTGTSAQEALVEHGVAPADRIGRLIEGVLRRLDDDLAAATPHTARIAGDGGRWAALLEHFATAVTAAPE